MLFPWAALAARMRPSLIASPLTQRNAYMVAAGVIGGLYILCAVILSVGVREKRGETRGCDALGLLEELWPHLRVLPPKEGLRSWDGFTEWQCCGQKDAASSAHLTALLEMFISCGFGWLSLCASCGIPE